jgi:hypothetical protein
MPTLFTKNYKDFVVKDNDKILREFHDARLARKCLPGDTVSIECENGCTLIERCEHPVICGLIELNSKTKYGFTSKNVAIYLFVPFNESYPPFVVGCSERDTHVNRLALIRFENIWADTFPRGSLMRLLDIGADTEALYWTYSPWACVNYKGTFPDLVSLDKRVILDDCFHIDPVGCKDVDDVLMFSTEEGRDYVTITIADVSAAIAEGSPLDLRASKISQTFYQDGVNPKPMFPILMSEGQLSLLKGARKPGLSLKVCLDDLTMIWFESAVNVTQTFDYESIYRDDGLVSKLKKMSLAFGLESDDSHKWIEAAMKFYNVEAAKLLKQAGAGVMRSHTGPDLERYNKLVPDLVFLANSAAKYVPPFGMTRHVGLGEDAYCHVTSPIRRYADLINQRHLKHVLFGITGNIDRPVDYDRLNEISKKAKQHDRDLVFLKALKKTGTGAVSGIIAEIREFDNNYKLSIYVDSWKLMVKIKYKRGTEENTILSKDETNTMSISLGQVVTINYHSNLVARCWKRRIVLKLC